MNKTKWMLGLLSVALSQEAVFADSPFEGIRTGIQAGYGLIDAKVKFARSTSPNASDSSDVSGRGIIAGFGYDWCGVVGNSNVWVGAEINLNFITSKGRKNTQGTFILGPATTDLTTTVMMKRSLDVAFKFGYMARGAALAYAKVGPSLASWRANSVSITDRSQGSSSANILGLIIGIGAEFPLSERFSWGAEYAYRHYKDFSHPFISNTGVSSRNISVSPSSNAIMLRLNYKMSATDFAASPPEKERKRKKYKKPRDDDEY